MNTKETTVVHEVEMDNLEDFLGAGAESVMVPGGDDEKKNVLSSLNVDTKFLDNPDDPAKKKEEDDAKAKLAEEEAAKLEKEKEDPTSIDAIAKELDDEDDQNKGGRPTLNKDVMVETASKLIEKGVMFPFDDEKKLEDYSAADWEELLLSNFNDKEAKLREELPVQFMASLPPELQKAYAYVQQGGKDLNSMFKALSSAQEINQLDPSTENGGEQIVRAYLQTTRYGTPEEIEEEIDSLRDRDELQGKAEKWKPRLDQMEEQTINQKIQAQANAKAKQQEQAKLYEESVYSILQPGELNGLKLDNRTQNMLFAGLVQPNYPSISGKPTTMLGHLLEKYQWVEPNHDLIAETLWLLADPDGYKAQIKNSASKKTVEETVRLLKTEESTKRPSSVADTEKEDLAKPGTRKVPRQKRNFFEKL
tara:strand:- start:2260 stop:3522 length:1263 start_codon:yes stop_codon:yes gene_type:complete